MSLSRIPGQDLTAPICVTCGTQYPPGAPPERCPICEDERQYVGQDGQNWTDLRSLAAGGHSNEVREQEPRLVGIATSPSFAIGQRALLVQTDDGNLLWDCISVLDDRTIEAVETLGGVRAIAISHPHFFSSMVVWSRVFQAPIYLHEANREHVMRPDPEIRYWSGAGFELFGGITLHNTGGHFDGFQVAHWPAGAGGKGALFSGDEPAVCADPRWVTFMYSYPNYIPLPAEKINRIVRILDPLPFDRIYSAWWPRVVSADAKEVVQRSATRYLRAIS